MCYEIEVLEPKVETFSPDLFSVKMAFKLVVQTAMILLALSYVASALDGRACDPSEEFECVSRTMGRQCCFRNAKYCDPASGCTKCPLAGQVSCDGTNCVDLMTNRDFCGLCSRRCMPGYSCCEGSCYDLQNNTDNCGRCNYNCQPSELCCKGKCVETTESNGLCPP